MTTSDSNISRKPARVGSVFPIPDTPLQEMTARAILVAGGITNLAIELGVSRQVLFSWRDKDVRSSLAKIALTWYLSIRDPK